MTELVTRYLQCWNETDADARAARVADLFAPAATYVDPLVEASGHEQLTATIGAVQQQFPGFVFTAVGTPDEHHRQTRFQWGLGPAGEEPPIVGFDVAVTDDDGRIASVLGFLDRVPAA